MLIKPKLINAYQFPNIFLTENKEGRVIEYADLCKHYLGRPGEICATIFSSLTLVGASIIIWVLMSNFLYNVVLFIFGECHSYHMGTGAC